MINRLDERGHARTCEDSASGCAMGEAGLQCRGCRVRSWNFLMKHSAGRGRIRPQKPALFRQDVAFRNDRSYEL